MQLPRASIPIQTQLHGKQSGRMCPQESWPGLTVNSGEKILKVKISVALCGVLFVYSWLVRSLESLHMTFCMWRKLASWQSLLLKFISLLVIDVGQAPLPSPDVASSVPSYLPKLFILWLLEKGNLRWFGLVLPRRWPVAGHHNILVLSLPSVQTVHPSLSSLPLIILGLCA